MKRIADRDPAVVAIVGTLLVAVTVLAALGLNRLPFLHPETTYTAEFANSGGLKTGDDVRVGGVSVGSVESVTLAGDHVEVRFGVTEGLSFGADTSASIEIATVLGNVFLQVTSDGSGQLDPATPIPLARTSVPFTLLDAFSKLATTTHRTDLPTLEKSLTALSAALSGISRPDVRATLHGLASFTSAIASRRAEISELLDSTAAVVDVLHSKGRAIIQLLSASDTFLQMLNDRHVVIQRLFRDTAALGAELSDLIDEAGAPLTSALRSVDQLAAVLAHDDAQIRQSITALGQFSVNIANVTGNGPWLDVLLPTALIPDGVIAACGKHPEPGCGR
jgi:phospholipid/cholesterol/gamma-HCH transport system substrate-binding protein